MKLRTERQSFISLKKSSKKEKKRVINQEKLRYHYNEGLKERDKLVKEKIEEMKQDSQILKIGRLN